MTRKHTVDKKIALFGKTLKRELAHMGKENTTELQKAQLEGLVDLEKQFRKALISHKWGKKAYQGFMDYICLEKKNILAARPFFRVRQPTFTSFISVALKAKNLNELTKYHFNFQFIHYIMKRNKFGKNSDLARLYSEIIIARKELITINLPLVLNRAGIFWSRTPNSHLTYMDLVLIASEGLISAIDKYCLPYSKVFRSVAIGRMVGNFISQYSETLVHFFPDDKRKLYRGNKAVRRFKEGEIDYEALAEAINFGASKEHLTTASEIADLMSAASLMSTENGTEEEIRAGGILASHEAPPSVQPDVLVENSNLIENLGNAIDQLSVLEQKFLKLRGITINIER